MVNLKQMSRFSEEEIQILRDNFSGEGEQILYQIRNVFLQLTDKAPELPEEVVKILSKSILKGLTDDVPFGCQADVYISLSEILKTYPPEIAYLHLEARDIANEYIKQRFRVMEGKGISPSDIKLEDLKKGETQNDRVVNMLAYLHIVNAYIDSCLNELQLMAKSEKMTEEEMKKKAEKDSAK